MRKLTLLLVVAVVFVSVQALGMGLDFGITSSIPVVEPTIAEPQFGKFFNPKTISEISKDWLITVDKRTGDIFKVNKHDTSIDEFLFHIDGRITSVQYDKGRIWVGNMDGASAPGGAMEVYTVKGKLTKKMHKVVWYASDMAIYGKRLFVIDSGDRTLKVFDTFGWLLKTINMTRPCNVFVTGSGKKTMVYVSDNGGTIDGKYGKVSIDASVTRYTIYNDKWKITGLWNGSDFGFSRPRGMSIKNGILYIVDTLQGTLVGIELRTGLSVNSIGEFGSEKGQMVSPKDVYYDGGTDTFFVVDGFKGSIESVKEY